jgi:hypothetical protein
MYYSWSQKIGLSSGGDSSWEKPYKRVTNVVSFLQPIYKERCTSKGQQRSLYSSAPLIRPLSQEATFLWPTEVHLHYIVPLTKGHPSYVATFSVLEGWPYKRRRHIVVLKFWINLCWIQESTIISSFDHGPFKDNTILCFSLSSPRWKCSALWPALERCVWLIMWERHFVKSKNWKGHHQ